MATITPTYAQVGQGDGSYALFTWVLLTASPDGSPLEMLDKSECCIQSTGTYGGATLSWQGSNDGTNWFTCTNVAGATAATMTAAGGMQIIERPLYMRPNLTAVGAGATITVTAMLRRNQPGRL
jgi:hypothetical protein